MIEYHKKNNQMICLPEGEIIASNVPAMRDSLIEQLDRDHEWQELILDCQKVETLDSIGINLVVGLFKKATAMGKSFRVVGCNPSLIKVLRLFRLDEQFTVEAKDV